MNPYKERFARKTKLRHARRGLEGGGRLRRGRLARLMTGEMLKTMAKDPIVFAMANPGARDHARGGPRAARPDVIMATGRSDYPNQVNNVLGFRSSSGSARQPGEPDQRGHEARRLPRPRRLAKEDVPRRRRPRLRRRGLPLRAGVPDPQAVRLPRAPARGPGRGPPPPPESGVARKPIADLEAYRDRLAGMLSPSALVHAGHPREGPRRPLRVVLAEGDHPKIQRAGQLLAEEGLARPILVSIGPEGRARPGSARSSRPPSRSSTPRRTPGSPSTSRPTTTRRKAVTERRARTPSSTLKERPTTSPR